MRYLLGTMTLTTNEHSRWASISSSQAFPAHEEMVIHVTALKGAGGVLLAVPAVSLHRVMHVHVHVSLKQQLRGWKVARTKWYTAYKCFTEFCAPYVGGLRIWTGVDGCMAYGVCMCMCMSA